MIKTYSELVSLPTFKERYSYLKLDGKVGGETFGYKRYINQSFYHSQEWFKFRDEIIVRDCGRDLGIVGHEIYGSIIIHHLNPITCEDIVNRNRLVLDQENVICTKHSTHNAIHYGDENLLIVAPIERSKNDTCPWKNI